MKEEDIVLLIIKQRSGDLSAAETNTLRQWYDTSEENRKAYRDYCTILFGQEIERDKRLFTPHTEASWHRLTARSGFRTKRINMFKPLLRYAAVGLIAIGMGWYAGTLSDHSDNRHVCVEAPDGSRSVVTLPDGSRVWLNSGSRLSYDEGFGRANRNMFLDGEGFFSVTKNKQLPFCVTSGDTKIKVLGTKFDMKAYSSDPNKHITLVEGSLSVTVGGRESILRPNQQACISGGKTTVRDVQADIYTEWTQTAREKPTTVNSTADKHLPTMTTPSRAARRTLIFDKEPLAQIVRDLGRAFNVEIKVEGELSDEVFYGDFRNDESIYQILDIISATGNISYRIEQGAIVITKKKQ